MSEADRYKLTGSGLLAAWIATCEESGKKFTIWNGFKIAINGKGIFFSILAFICLIVCVPIGYFWRGLKRCFVS
ncbi:hypothetical protein KKF61_08285 [Patescibacteria group bacterium]|nr:hypothetical protein [Patescibacteria group bacterium]